MIVRALKFARAYYQFYKTDVVENLKALAGRNFAKISPDFFVVIDFKNLSLIAISGRCPIYREILHYI